VFPTRSRTGSFEHAFSLIEVIIAMTILSVVLGGAAYAVSASDSAQVHSAAVVDSHAIAQKAVERLQADLTARGQCDQQAGWKATARSTKLAGSATAPTFNTCLVEYDDMRDPKGRRYLVDLNVQPIDATDDGVGANDTDGNLRDRYELVTTVELASDSKAGRESDKPVSVAGSVDWKGGATDAATIQVIACGVDRKDWSLVGGGCVTGEPSRTPLSVTQTLKQLSAESGARATCPTG
jgi:prepilin-type N-terminal cleavage/methylation domain-containing protein